MVEEEEEEEKAEEGSLLINYYDGADFWAQESCLLYMSHVLWAICQHHASTNLVLADKPLANFRESPSDPSSWTCVLFILLRVLS